MLVNGGAERIEMQPPRGFARAHAGTPPGTWSDDGAQALALLDSLLTNDGLAPDDLARRLLAWSDEGRYAVDERVFDIGIQTSHAFRALREGTPALDAGPDGEWDNGNGSLMRVLPLALWQTGSDADLVRDARLQSRVTHGHVRSHLACALYCLWARRIATAHPAPWEDAASTLARLAAPAERDELDQVLAYDGDLGTGYVVSTLHSAREALRAGGYEAVVRAAIAMGTDTDTTACVAGGLAGLRDGPDAIPDRWMRALRGRDIAEPLLDRLLAARA
ncbi:MAG TPA: ADP-ribosylglycohydrolase family protein [Bacteroidetes bacterium]|nr:ADP-ribosylglycohydrolase family protein [Bacteroidota bacterium]